jgi:hypothetical protein
MPLSQQDNSRAVEVATAIDKLHHELGLPAKDVYIVPLIKRNSLLCIPKFVKANYIEIFDKDKVDI